MSDGDGGEEMIALPVGVVVRAVMAERERCEAIADRYAEECKAKYDTETDWRQPYASNRVVRACWAIAASIRDAAP